MQEAKSEMYWGSDKREDKNSINLFEIGMMERNHGHVVTFVNLPWHILRQLRSNSLALRFNSNIIVLNNIL